MSVSHGASPATARAEGPVWPRIVTAVATLGLWVGGILLWARVVLPPVVDWAFQSRRDSPAVTLTGWAMVAGPLLVLAVVELRKGLLERAGDQQGTIERRISRALLGLGFVTVAPLAPGRGPASRQGWEHLALGHGATFERAVTWSLFGAMALVAVGAVVVLRGLSRGTGMAVHLMWSALAVVAAVLPLVALLIRLATLA